MEKEEDTGEKDNGNGKKARNGKKEGKIRKMLMIMMQGNGKKKLLDQKVWK